MTAVAIIGAGPSGSWLGERLAKAGFDTTIYEEHDQPGKPEHCTGLVTRVLFDRFPVDRSLVMNELRRVRVVSPAGQELDIPLREYVLSRCGLDEYLARRAEAAGAKLLTGHRFSHVKDGVVTLRHKGAEVHAKPDILVGADGPLSSVAKAAGIFGQREFYFGLQVWLKGAFDTETFTTYFGDLAPGFFAWVVPQSADTARVGIATTSNTRQYFESFLKRIGTEVVSRQAGPIPFYHGSIRAAGAIGSLPVYTVGDAAGLAKATTGGGIITGMLSADILADCISKGRDYERALHPLRRELWLHERIRRAMNKFSEKDYEHLVRHMANPRVKRILEKHPREYPSKFIWKLLLAEPRLLRFATKLL
jgi:geranylgeranyl reductase family protein